MKLTPILISLAAIAFTAQTASAQSTKIPEAVKTEAKALPVGTFAEIDGDHTKGKAGAPVTMIIYASVTCPHCSHWFETVWPKLNKEYVDKGELRIVFREFPTAPAQLAIAGFQIANCAPEDKYFSLIEHQMAEQENIIEGVKAGKGLETYLAIAKLAGLEDKEQMDTCLESEAGIEKMQASMAMADAAKVTGVPAFIIDGKLYKENGEYAPLKKHLDGLLARGFTPAPKR